VHEFLLSDTVFLEVQPLGAGEHRGGTTCVDVMHHAVEGLGRGGTWAQQRRERLEQLLYLRRECGDGGGGLGPQRLVKEVVLAFGKGRSEAACRTCCLEGIIDYLGGN
jgi:hypothetical protein